MGLSLVTDPIYSIQPRLVQKNVTLEQSVRVLMYSLHINKLKHKKKNLSI